MTLNAMFASADSIVELAANDLKRLVLAKLDEDKLPEMYFGGTDSEAASEYARTWPGNSVEGRVISAPGIVLYTPWPGDETPFVVLVGRGIFSYSPGFFNLYPGSQRLWCPNVDKEIYVPADYVNYGKLAIGKILDLEDAEKGTPIIL